MSRDEVREEMRELLEEAEAIFSDDPELAHRSAEKAWNLKLSTRTELPGNWKRFVCRECQSFLMPGENARIRVRRGRVITRCRECGSTRRFVID